MNATMIKIHHIRTEGLQLRAHGTDDKVVADYKELLDKLTPVLLFRERADLFWLADGHHTFAAYAGLGKTEIPAEVREGDYRAAKLAAIGANADHGLHRTQADKRRAVEALLSDAEWSTWSNVAIAKAAHVSESLVRTMRPDQPRLNEVEIRKGLDNKERRIPQKESAPSEPSQPALPLAAPTLTPTNWHAFMTDEETIAQDTARRAASTPAQLDEDDATRTAWTRACRAAKKAKEPAPPMPEAPTRYQPYGLPPTSEHNLRNQGPAGAAELEARVKAGTPPPTGIPGLAPLRVDQLPGFQPLFTDGPGATLAGKETSCRPSAAADSADSGSATAPPAAAAPSPAGAAAVPQTTPSADGSGELETSSDDDADPDLDELELSSEPVERCPTCGDDDCEDWDGCAAELAQEEQALAAEEELNRKDPGRVTLAQMGRAVQHAVEHVPAGVEPEDWDRRVAKELRMLAGDLDDASNAVSDEDALRAELLELRPVVAAAEAEIERLTKIEQAYWAAQARPTPGRQIAALVTRAEMLCEMDGCRTYVPTPEQGLALCEIHRPQSRCPASRKSDGARCKMSGSHREHAFDDAPPPVETRLPRDLMPSLGTWPASWQMLGRAWGCNWTKPDHKTPAHAGGSIWERAEWIADHELTEAESGRDELRPEEWKDLTAGIAEVLADPPPVRAATAEVAPVAAADELLVRAREMGSREGAEAARRVIAKEKGSTDMRAAGKVLADLGAKKDSRRDAAYAAYAAAFDDVYDTALDQHAAQAAPSITPPPDTLESQMGATEVEDALPAPLHYLRTAGVTACGLPVMTAPETMVTSSWSETTCRACRADLDRDQPAAPMPTTRARAATDVLQARPEAGTPS